MGPDGVIQLAPQFRILVAIEAIDGRKGIETVESGPAKGVGALYVKEGTKLESILQGGGQERALLAALCSFVCLHRSLRDSLSGARPELRDLARVARVRIQVDRRNGASVRIDADTRQPTSRRANTSMTKATKTKPPHVAT